MLEKCEQMFSAVSCRRVIKVVGYGCVGGGVVGGAVVGGTLVGAIEGCVLVVTGFVTRGVVVGGRVLGTVLLGNVTAGCFGPALVVVGTSMRQCGASFCTALKYKHVKSW